MADLPILLDAFCAQHAALALKANPRKGHGSATPDNGSHDFYATSVTVMGVRRLERKTLRRAFSAATNRLEERHWGTEAPGERNGVPRYYVFDLRGLLLAAGVLRYELNRSGMMLFYRGQVQDWDLVPALFRGAKHNDLTARVRHLNMCIRAIADKFDPKGTDDEREALAQHYGLPTRWLDVLDNVQTAAWFAGHDPNPGEDRNRRDASVGYVQVLACHRDNSRGARAMDLRVKPSQWMRPHIQQAWAIQSSSPPKNNGSLTSHHVCTFVVPRPLLHSWSGYGMLSVDTMFPNPSEDEGLRFWLKAKEHLESNGLLPYPWESGPEASQGRSLASPAAHAGDA